MGLWNDIYGRARTTAQNMLNYDPNSLNNMTGNTLDASSQATTKYNQPTYTNPIDYKPYGELSAGYGSYLDPNNSFEYNSSAGVSQPGVTNGQVMYQDQRGNDFYDDGSIAFVRNPVALEGQNAPPSAVSRQSIYSQQRMNDMTRLNNQWETQNQTRPTEGMNTPTAQYKGLEFANPTPRAQYSISKR